MSSTQNLDILHVDAEQEHLAKAKGLLETTTGHQINDNVVYSHSVGHILLVLSFLEDFTDKGTGMVLLF